MDEYLLQFHHSEARNAEEYLQLRPTNDSTHEEADSNTSTNNDHNIDSDSDGESDESDSSE